MEISSLFRYIPQAIEGLKKVFSLIGSALKSSKIVQTICDLFKKKVPTPTQVIGAAKEAVDLKSIFRSEGQALLRKFRTFTPKEESAMAALQEAPHFEAYKQVLVQDMSYVSLPVGKVLPASKHFACPSYKIEKVLQYDTGLKMIFLTAQNSPPLVVIRGTDPSNITNVMDDLSSTIGEINFTAHKAEIEHTLKTFRAEHGRMNVIGHSYGGAMAELLTATYPELFASCTTHNGAGTSKKIVDRFIHNIEQLPSSTARPEITHYRHAKDFVSLVGAHLPTEEGRFITMGTSSDDISHIDAHSLNTLSQRVSQKRTGTKVAYGSMSSFTQFVNMVRNELGQVVPAYNCLV